LPGPPGPRRSSWPCAITPGSRRTSATAFHRLEQAGWHIVVASAGCDFYIRPILAKVGVEANVIAHPGTFEVGRGLTMHSLEETPFAHPHFGLNKAAVVQHYLATGLPVAFAGDGTPDLEPLLLVPADYRFATGWAAKELALRGEAFTPFERWPDLVPPLLNRT
jgi:2-hydroxy-3-keto-5-methylthiopentenyl-1-phosphate phosphatase